MIIHEIKRLHVLFSLFIILSASSPQHSFTSSSCAENRQLIDVHHQPKIRSIDCDTVELLNGAINKATHVSQVQLIHKDECFFVREGRTIIPIKKYLIDKKEMRELSQEKLIQFLENGGCIRLSQNGCGDYTLNFSGRLLGGVAPFVIPAAKWLFQGFVKKVVKKAVQEGGKKLAQETVKEGIKKTVLTPEQTAQAISVGGGVIISGVLEIKNLIFGGATTTSVSAPKPQSAPTPQVSSTQIPAVAPAQAATPSQSASSAPKLQSISVSQTSQASSPKAPSAPATAQTHSLGQSASSSATPITQSAAASKPSCPQPSSSLAPTQSTPKPQSTPATAIHIPKPTTTIKDSVVPAALQKVATSSPSQTQPITTSAPLTITTTPAPAAPVVATDTKIAFPAANVSITIPQQPVTHVTTLGAPQKQQPSVLSAQVRTLPSQSAPQKIIPPAHGPVVTITVHDNAPNFTNKGPTHQEIHIQDLWNQLERAQAAYQSGKMSPEQFAQQVNQYEEAVKSITPCSEAQSYPKGSKITHNGKKVSTLNQKEFDQFKKEETLRLANLPCEDAKNYPNGAFIIMHEYGHKRVCDLNQYEFDKCMYRRPEDIKRREDARIAHQQKAEQLKQRNNDADEAAKAGNSATVEPAFAKPPCSSPVETPTKPQGCPTPLPVAEKPTGCGSPIPQQPQPTPGCGGNLPEELTKPIGCGKPRTPIKFIGCEKQAATQKEVIKDNAIPHTDTVIEIGSSKPTPSLETPIATDETVPKLENPAIDSTNIPNNILTLTPEQLKQKYGDAFQGLGLEVIRRKNLKHIVNKHMPGNKGARPDRSSIFNADEDCVQIAIEAGSMEPLCLVDKLKNMILEE